MKLLLLLLAGAAMSAAQAVHNLPITNRGVTETNVPIGGPAGTVMEYFADGEIPPGKCPQAMFDGTAVATQADVKQAYPSGSPRQVIIAAVFPSVTVGAHTVTYQPGACNNTPLTQSQMLNEFDFGAQIRLTSGGVTVTADARAMLAAGDCSYWTRGPIAQTMLCAADGQTVTCNMAPCSKYDIGFDAYKSFRPRFYVTFWPTLNHSYSVTYIGENGQSETIQDQHYDLALFYGNKSPTQWYAKLAFSHWGLARWIKRKWAGAQPPNENYDIHYNLAWLESLHVIAPYDLSLTISQSTLENYWLLFQQSPTDLGETGLWDPSMGQGGGAGPSIGPYPEWYVVALYSGDARLREIMFTQADLAANWQSHYREGHTGRILNPGDTGNSGLGRIVSGYGRPQFSSVNWPGACPSVCGADKIMQIGDITTFNVAYDKNNGIISYTGNGWLFDPAHLPEAFSIPYILTGDFAYLEEQYFWTAHNIDKQYVFKQGRALNPTVLTCNNVLARALAWDIRTRAEAISIAPDRAPEKTYFSDALTDCIAVEEGVRQITTTANHGTPAWSQGRNNVAAWYDKGFPFYKGDFEAWTNGSSGYPPPPLHQMMTGAPYLTQCDYLSLNCVTGAGTLTVASNGLDLTFSDPNACNALPIGTMIGIQNWGQKTQLLTKTCPTATVQDYLNPGSGQVWETAGDTLMSNGGFMELYLWGALGRAAEQGFATRPLYSWASYYYLNVMAGTGNINPWVAGAGRVPVTSVATLGGYIQTFGALATHFAPNFSINVVGGGPDGYFAYLRYGLAYAAGEPLASQASAWYLNNVIPVIGWATNPKWAFNTPSGAQPAQPQIEPPGPDRPPILRNCCDVKRDR